MRILFLCLAVLTITGCKKTAMKDGCADKPVPACITEKINAILKSAKGQGSDVVVEYQYNNKRVFYFSPYCCDMFGEVFDENCLLICAPDGGITGQGDGRCVDFFKTATLVRQVWKDPR